MLKTEAVIILVAAAFAVYQVKGQVCTYIDTCERAVSPPPDCGPWPWCRNYTISYPCLKQEGCALEWSEWSPCTRPCGGGMRFRRSVCTGTECSRIFREVQTCNDVGCLNRVNGQWSEWSPWISTQCTETCCGGTYSMTRTRTCTNPAPQGTGRNCSGEDTDVRFGMPCGMADSCPLSCVGEEIATSFPDPCGGACGRRFFSCGGGQMPVELECPSGLYWSIANNTCQPMEMCSA